MFIGMMAITLPSEAGNGKEKRSGKKTAQVQQKKTVKLGKKQMRGLKKASKVVNKRLSKGY